MKRKGTVNRLLWLVYIGQVTLHMETARGHQRYRQSVAGEDSHLHVGACWEPLEINSFSARVLDGNP
jgi:hypothetical protein